MSRAFRVTLSGQSEELFRELNGLGLSDHDILSRAFWYLKQVHTTGRVALLKNEALTDEGAEAFVEVVYTVLEPTSRRPRLSVEEFTQSLANQIVIDSLRKKGFTIQGMGGEEHGSA